MSSTFDMCSFARRRHPSARRGTEGNLERRKTVIPELPSGYDNGV